MGNPQDTTAAMGFDPIKNRGLISAAEIVDRLEGMEAANRAALRRARVAMAGGLAALIFGVVALVVAYKLSKDAERTMAANLAELAPARITALQSLHVGTLTVGQMAMLDVTGRPAAILRFSEQGGPVFSMIGKHRASLNMGLVGSDRDLPSFQMLNAEGHSRLSFALTPDGPRLNLSEADGKQGLILTTSDKLGHSLLSVADRDSQALLMIGMLREGNPTLDMFNKAGDHVESLP